MTTSPHRFAAPDPSSSSSSPGAPVRVRSPGELAAAVPELLGFAPAESLVVMGLHEPRGRLGLTMRFDLAAGEVLVDEVVTRLDRERATRAVLLVVTEEPDTDDDLPSHGLVEDLVDQLEQRSIEVSEALLVRSGRWWSFVCTGSCCPAQGSPVRVGEGAAGLIAAERVLTGDVLRGSRAEVAAALEPLLPLGPAFRRAELDVRARELAEACAEDPEAAELHEVERLHRALADPGALGSDQAARCAVALRLRNVRETVLGWICGDARAVRLLAVALCRTTPDPEAAPVLLVLGAAAYAEGNGALAAIALERSLAADPEATMAQLLWGLLMRQVPPAELREMLDLGSRRLAGRRAFPGPGFPGPGFPGSGFPGPGGT